MDDYIPLRYRTIKGKIQLFKRDSEWMIAFMNCPGWPKNKVQLLPYTSWERAHEGLLCLLRQTNRYIQTGHLSNLL